MRAHQESFGVHMRLCRRPLGRPLDRREKRCRAVRRCLQGSTTNDSDAQRVLSPFDALSEAVRGTIQLTDVASTVPWHSLS